MATRKRDILSAERTTPAPPTPGKSSRTTTWCDFFDGLAANTAPDRRGALAKRIQE
jgi:hypothetical protein